jgi:hypothetical protein
VPRARRVVIVVFVLGVWSLTTHGKFSDSGDEPHYLMIAESLTSDHDFDLANNYARGDGRWFGADDLVAGPHARPTRLGSTWSAHDVGLPVLILPVYAAATRAAAHAPVALLAKVRQTRGLFAYSLISLAFIALTAWGLSLFMSALARDGSPSLAWAIGLVVGLSPPILSHAFLVFPETPAFFVVSAVLWLRSLPDRDLTSRRVWLVTAAIGALPWLHRKYSFFVFGLALILVVAHRAWLSRQRAATIWGLVALLVLPQLALHVTTFVLWGNLGGPQMLDTLPFSAAALARGTLGLLIDRERGLAAYAPIFLMLPAVWLRVRPRDRTLAVPILLLFVPMAAFAVWSAGFSPAARYLVPLVPLLVYPAVQALTGRPMIFAAMLCVIFQAAITAIVWGAPRTLWPLERGTNQALERIPVVGVLYERFLPSMLTGDSVGRGMVVLAAIVAVGAVLAAVSAGGTHSFRRRARSVSTEG